MNQRVDRYPGWELEIGDRTCLYLYCKQKAGDDSFKLWDLLERQISNWFPGQEPGNRDPEALPRLPTKIGGRAS
ncbi:MAG: hypothetical protein EAZ78_13500 [Oscillatoriales cyanobacterium]|uniref:Transposase n=1 Tax=Microcoleus anatoxicus PTRS2 TaxID=2705321 RepID=A0ABU8YUG9_9CYAN|nr:MAG: hypothetical protein EA000_15095 [Oscillatoriales cyanobacterium]TAD97287.1 MAG: hypothetical protein EAZ98_10090 [Oscillatoriales cyanobacterium]TAF03088.1 MAG: hypothetical protein EAZ78_13500 [Oscillatoriales cyanobacterium]TAF47373.1 MAG: hypothetical protein EAZ68_01885 [Oscillatoriales cyanobacterium]TAF64314.1 MAG: hypothetical protein EAZ59_18700 [Oscillatoriales cyanobacterium]